MINACEWFLTHYRTRQRDSGTLAVARQLRKQGVPLEVALSVLVTTPVWEAHGKEKRMYLKKGFFSVKLIPGDYIAEWHGNDGINIVNYFAHEDIAMRWCEEDVRVFICSKSTPPN